MANIAIEATLVHCSLTVKFSSDGVNYDVLDSPVVTTAGTYQFIFNADAGYYINKSNPIHYYVDKRGTYTSDTAYASGTSTYIEKTYTDSEILAMKQPVKVSAKAVVIPDSYHLPVTWDIEHATTPDSEDLKLYIPRTVTITADSGYIFTENGELGYTNSAGKYNKLYNIVASGTNKQDVILGVNGTPSTSFTGITVVMPAQLPPVAPSTASLTLNLTDIDSNINDSTINLNETYNFTFTPKAGYELNNNGTISYFEKDLTLIKTDEITVDNKLSNSFSITPTANTDNITITMVATVKKPETISVDQSKVINATSSVAVGDSLTYSKQVITFTANDNYIFDEAGYIGYTDPAWGDYDKITIPATNTNTAVVTVDFTGKSNIQGVEFVISANGGVSDKWRKMVYNSSSRNNVSQG